MKKIRIQIILYFYWIRAQFQMAGSFEEATEKSRKASALARGLWPLGRPGLNDQKQEEGRYDRLNETQTGLED